MGRTRLVVASAFSYARVALDSSIIVRTRSLEVSEVRPSSERTSLLFVGGRAEVVQNVVMSVGPRGRRVHDGFLRQADEARGWFRAACAAKRSLPLQKRSRLRLWWMRRRASMFSSGLATIACRMVCSAFRSRTGSPPPPLRGGDRALGYRVLQIDGAIDQQDPVSAAAIPRRGASSRSMGPNSSMDPKLEGEGARGWVIPHRVPVFVAAVPGEDAPRTSLAGRGRTVVVPALAACQFLGAHRHSSAIGPCVQDGGRFGSVLGRAALPVVGRPFYPLYHALDLPGIELDATRLGEMAVRRLKAGLIRSFQAEQAGQIGGVTAFQLQGRIGRVAAPGASGVVEIAPLQTEASEQTLQLRSLAGLAALARARLVVAIRRSAACCRSQANRPAAGLQWRPGSTLPVAAPRERRGPERQTGRVTGLRKLSCREGPAEGSHRRALRRRRTPLRACLKMRQATDSGSSIRIGSRNREAGSVMRSAPS